MDSMYGPTHLTNLSSSGRQGHDLFGEDGVCMSLYLQNQGSSCSIAHTALCENTVEGVLLF
jgi:hypothetical protein